MPVNCRPSILSVAHLGGRRKCAGFKTRVEGCRDFDNGRLYVSNTTCGATLDMDAKCNISVTFAPTAVGTRAGPLSVSDSAPDSPQTAGPNGTGTPGRGADLAPPKYTFLPQFASVALYPSRGFRLPTRPVRSLAVHPVRSPGFDLPARPALGQIPIWQFRPALRR